MPFIQPEPIHLEAPETVQPELEQYPVRFTAQHSLEGLRAVQEPTMVVTGEIISEKGLEAPGIVKEVKREETVQSGETETKRVRTENQRKEARLGKREVSEHVQLERGQLERETLAELNKRAFGGDKSNIRSLFWKGKSGVEKEYSPELKKHGVRDVESVEKSGVVGKERGEWRRQEEQGWQTPKRGRGGWAGGQQRAVEREEELRRVLDSDCKLACGMKRSKYHELKGQESKWSGREECPGGGKVELASLSSLLGTTDGRKYPANDPRRLYQELKENILWLKSTQSPNALN